MRRPASPGHRGIQQTSAQNTWLKEPHDADWVYGYDAWTVPLA